MTTAKLARILNHRDLVFLFIGAVIGSGIFLVPHRVMGYVGGSIGLALAAWLVGGVLALAGALTFGELAASDPAVGGPYVFIRDAFGRIPAFLYGWVAFLAGSGASRAALGAAFGATLATLLEGTVSVPPWSQKLLSLGAIAVFTALNVRGTRRSADVMNWSTAIKIGALNSTFLTRPRIFFAMAHDGLFYRKLAEVHPRYGTPAFAIMASTLCAVPFALSGTFEQILTYFVFATAAFDVILAACVFRHRRRVTAADRPYHVPGYPWTPILFILATLAILGNLLVTKPKEALVGLGIVALGLPAYFIWRVVSGRATASPATRRARV